MVDLRKKAPDFCLPAAVNKEVCLADSRGKWVGFFFYVKDNNSGRTIEALEFSELKPEFDSHGGVILGVSPDSVDSQKRFIQKKGIGIELLSDPEHSVLTAYGAWGLKKMYVKEYEGVIRRSILIYPEGIVRRTWPKAQAKGHANEMLEALRALKG